MGASGGFPIDLVLFGMIAAFLVLRLRSILGKRTGFERQAPPIQPVPLRPATGPIIEAKAEPPQPAAAQTVPDVASPTGQALAQMRAIDPGFDPARFLAGADQAFRMIVAAFAAGDRVGLRALLSDETYEAFEQAISAREKAGETQVSEIKSMQQSEHRRGGAEGAGRIGDGEDRVRPGQLHPGQGRPALDGHRRGDGDHRSVDVRARSVAAGSDLAAGGGAQRLIFSGVS